MAIKKINDVLWINPEHIASIEKKVQSYVKKGSDNKPIINNGVTEMEQVYHYVLMVNNKYISLTESEFDKLGISLD